MTQQIPPLAYDYKNLTRGFDYKDILLRTEEIDEKECQLDGFVQKTEQEKAALINKVTSVTRNAYNYIASFKDEYSQDKYSSQANYEALVAETGPHIEYLKKKIDHLDNRLLSLQSVGPTLTHPQFTTAAIYSGQNTTTSTRSYAPTFQHSPAVQNPFPVPLHKPVSYTIEEVRKSGAPQSKPDSLQAYDHLAYLLRNGQEQQALAKFDSLPVEIRETVYEALWLVKGRPSGGHPISHPKFGEVSFKNLEQRCSSTAQEKAAAVELAKIPGHLHTIVQLFERNDSNAAYQVFNRLPSQIQSEIYGKHWETMGRPTNESFDESLRAIAHPNFGKVSLLGLEPRCNADPNKKAATFKAYLADYRNKINTIQDAIDQVRSEWAAVDSSSNRGSLKNELKRESLNTFAKQKALLFLNLTSTPRPTSKGISYVSLAEAYADAYPCLRPFLFQLIPSLTVETDKLIEAGLTQDSPKSSQVVQVNLSAMPHTDRKAYLTNIMNETSETLKKGYYINSKGKKVSLDLKPAIASLYRIIKSDGAFKRTGQYQTQIFLDNKDCLTVTRDCARRGLSPIVLDAASDSHFGGEYKTGASAQEENACRRSGLCIAADPILEFQTKNFYPLTSAGPSTGLYVSKVPVFRGEEREGYPYLDEPFETAVAISAAYDFNEDHQRNNGLEPDQMKKLEFINGEYRIPLDEATATKEKLRVVFQMAQNNKHDSVVLIPHGCGAYRNPPKHICEMIMELVTQEFPHSFKEIHISIIDDHNTGKAHNPRGNYVAFKETIQNGFLDAMKKNGTNFTITQ